MVEPTTGQNSPNEIPQGPLTTILLAPALTRVQGSLTSMAQGEIQHSQRGPFLMVAYREALHGGFQLETTLFNHTWRDVLHAIYQIREQNPDYAFLTERVAITHRQIHNGQARGQVPEAALLIATIGSINPDTVDAMYDVDAWGSQVIGKGLAQGVQPAWMAMNYNYSGWNNPDPNVVRQQLTELAAKYHRTE